MGRQPKRVRVMVVDDSAIVRQQICKLLLTQTDIEVCEECGNGAEAVEKTRCYRPDLVLMDVSMPTMNGIEAAKVIHAENPGIQIVVLSQHDSSGFLKEAFGAGVSGYILKSNAVADLIPEIRRQQRQRTAAEND